MIGIMCLEHCSKQVRKIFKDFEVSIFSELDVRGYSSDKTSQVGWWPGDHEQPNFSSLCFAMISKEKADDIMDAIDKMVKEDETGHPIRAFLMDVERMI